MADDSSKPDWLRNWDPSKGAKIIPRSAWQPGQSGCPTGRPVGIVDKRVRLTKMLGDDAEALVAKAKELALAGDTTALGLLLARIAPTLKPRDEPTPFKFDSTLPMYEQAVAVIQAVADGSLNTSDGKVLLDMIHGLAAIRDIDELQRRIEALEKQASETSTSGALGGVRAI